MADPIPSDATVAAWVGLIRGQRAALQRVEGELKAQGFPPLAWYDVLIELRRAEGGALRPHEIEARLLLPQPNVSRLIDRLEKAGLAARAPCEADGRGLVVTLTDAGRELLRRMWPAYGAAIARHVGARLGDETEAATLARLLDRLVS